MSIARPFAAALVGFTLVAASCGSDEPAAGSATPDTSAVQDVDAGAVIVVSFAINAVTGLLGRLVPDIAILASLEVLFGLAASWALAIGVIALLFRFLTDVRIPWPPALLGGIVTAAMLAIGTMLVGAYLRRYASSSLVGATGSVFLVLVWIYYVAQIVLIGAELTRVLARWRAADGDLAVANSAAADGQAGVGPGEDATVDVDG